jgi:hypothetical protein
LQKLTQLEMEMKELAEQKHAEAKERLNVQKLA